VGLVAFQVWIATEGRFVFLAELDRGIFVEEMEQLPMLRTWRVAKYPVGILVGAAVLAA
jgi:hypothetical protein